MLLRNYPSQSSFGCCRSVGFGSFLRPFLVALRFLWLAGPPPMCLCSSRRLLCRRGSSLLPRGLSCGVWLWDCELWASSCRLTFLGTVTLLAVSRFLLLSHVVSALGCCVPSLMAPLLGGCWFFTYPSLWCGRLFFLFVVQTLIRFASCCLTCERWAGPLFYRGGYLAVSFTFASSTDCPLSFGGFCSSFLTSIVPRCAGED